MFHQIYSINKNETNSTFKINQISNSKLGANNANQVIDTKEIKFKQREQFYMKTIEHLQKEIEFKNEQIRHHNDAMDRKDKELRDLFHKMID